MDVIPRLRLINVLDLPNESEWLFSAQSAVGKRRSFRVCGEGVVIVVAVFGVHCPALWVAPHAILQDLVPNKSAPTLRNGRVRPNQTRVNDLRVIASIHSLF